MMRLFIGFTEGRNYIQRGTFKAFLEGDLDRTKGLLCLFSYEELIALHKNIADFSNLVFLALVERVKEDQQ